MGTTSLHERQLGTEAGGLGVFHQGCPLPGYDINSVISLLQVSSPHLPSEHIDIHLVEFL